MTSILTNKRFLWLTFVAIAIATLCLYVWTSYTAGQSHLLMPLDDVYIHFQYARQMALGHPYQYNLIDPPTSGATSLLYPYLLTIGYWLGFQGLWLGLWAMLLGIIALVASQWAVYRLCMTLEVPAWLSFLTSISFGLSGSIGWHFMSGMETGLVVTLILWTLLLVIEKRLIAFVIVATLLTITRPEGGLVSAIAAGTLFLRLWSDYGTTEKYPARRKILLILVLPILAFGLQPLVNLLITGTSVATGAQAKSILATVPADTTIIIGRIWDNFSRMWVEFLTGYDAREGRGWYLPILTGAIGLCAILMLLLKKNYRLIGLMLLGWLLILTMAISTLDNAFWHFKRYQMPMLALFFPLSAWAIASSLKRYNWSRYPIYIFSGIVTPIFAMILAIQFQQYHAMNVSYVYQQPFQMAEWLRDNTPEDALIAVHDVGLMRYHGERSTLDMVGLTTPNAATYWRNGPGSVAEFLVNQQPDYIASYGRGHGYGLAFLADTTLYENQLSEFTVDDWQPHLNVALAAPSQGIYQPDWNSIIEDTPVGQSCSHSLYASPFIADHDVTYLDVADIASEAQFNYQAQTTNLRGFATEVRQFGDQTRSYRLINEREAFTMPVPENSDDGVVLITQVHASSAGTINIYANDTLIDTQWIPANAGNTVNISTVIESQYIVDNTLHIGIVPDIFDGYYMPICHTVRKASILNVTFNSFMATYQNGTVSLGDFGYGEFPYTPDTIYVDLSWEINEVEPTGDYRLFVHLYDNRDQPPVAQWDNYLGGMPLGNWQVGYLTNEIREIYLDTSNLASGTYQIAIGFYNPNDPTDRLIPESDTYQVTPDGRLWLGEVEID